MQFAKGFIIQSEDDYKYNTSAPINIIISCLPVQTLQVTDWRELKLGTLSEVHFAL